MAERVQIIVEATDAASGVLRGITGQFGQLGNLVEDIASPTQNWGNVFATAATMVVTGVKKAVEETQTYAQSVRDLSQISGESAESTSRFLQVLDDYQLTAGDAEAATRALTKNGLAPTIDTLAGLSDEYNSLGSAEEKNEFIIKNLGRSGLQWVNLLKQGSAALREQGAAVEQSLILNDQQLAQAEELRLAQDRLNDSWQGIEITVGSRVIPVLTDIVDVMNADVTGLFTLGDAMKKASDDASHFANMNDKVAVYLRDIADWAAEIVNSTLPSWLKEVADAANGSTQALEGNFKMTKEWADAQKQNAKDVAEANAGIIGGMFSLNQESESYTKSEEDRSRRYQKLIEEKMKLESEYSLAMAANTGSLHTVSQSYLTDLQTQIEALTQKQRKGDTSKETQAALTELEVKYTSALQANSTAMNKQIKDAGWYLDQQEKITDVTQQINDLEREGTQAAEDHAQANDKLALSMLQARLAQDGWTTAETQFFMKQAVGLGVIDQASADAAVAASEKADSWEKAFQNVQTPIDETKKKMDDISAHNGEEIHIGIYYDMYNLPTDLIPTTTSNGTGPSTYMHSRGGSWVIPSAYGDEGYRMPGGHSASAGETVTITPAGQPAGNITNQFYMTVRNDNDMYYIAQEVTRIATAS